MYTLNITKEQFFNLKKLELNNNIFNTEAEMYFIDINNKKYILKKFNNESGTTFSNKLYTINELIDNKKTLILKN